MYKAMCSASIQIHFFSFGTFMKQPSQILRYHVVSKDWLNQEFLHEMLVRQTYPETETYYKNDEIHITERASQKTWKYPIKLGLSSEDFRCTMSSGFSSCDTPSYRLKCQPIIRLEMGMKNMKLNGSAILKEGHRSIVDQLWFEAIDVDVAEEIMVAFAYRSLTKVHYRLQPPSKSVEIFVSEYAGKLEGLTYVTVVIYDNEVPFVKPAWFGELIEADLSTYRLCSAQSAEEALT